MSRRNKRYRESVEEVKEEPVFTPEPEEEEEVIDVQPEEVLTMEPEPIKGKVAGCNQLNIRAEASTDSEVMAVINKNEEVTIRIPNFSDGWHFIEFYKSPITITGYVMSKFIEVEDGQHPNID